MSKIRAGQRIKTHNGWEFKVRRVTRDGFVYGEAIGNLALEWRARALQFGVEPGYIGTQECLLKSIAH